MMEQWLFKKTKYLLLLLPIDSLVGHIGQLSARHQQLGRTEQNSLMHHVVVVSEETGQLSICFEGKLRAIEDSFLKRAIKFSGGPVRI